MDEVQHLDPAWLDKADYVIRARITDAEYSKDFSHEQLAAKEIGNNSYEICCIPFFVYNLFLGDVVTLDAELYATKVLERSGHKGFRIATTSSV